MGNTTVLRIWDIWVRLFHWSLAASVLFLLFSGETGIGFFEWHRWAGEFVLMLLLFRLCWGIFGSSNVRLLSLIQHPAKVLHHLKDVVKGKAPQERGHNAAGGWAVLALLLLCSVQALTGIFIADEDEFLEGALYGTFGSDTTDWLYSIHHTNAELLQVLVAVHVLMVLVYLFKVGQNLIRPLFTGHVSWVGDSTPPTVRFAPWWLGAIALAVCYVAVAALLGWPPFF